MSCGNPATEADALMQRRKKYDKTKNCVKCRDALGNIVIRHAVYCKTCFLPLIVHRFRRALEPNVNPKPDGPRRTALKPTGNLLIGYSGGLGSSVLLDLVHRCYVALDQSTMPADGGRDHPRHERVWKEVTVCYVEACDAFPETSSRTENIAKHVARYDGLAFVALRLQDAFDPNWWARVGGRPSVPDLGVNLIRGDLLLESISAATRDPLTSLRAYLSALPTPTAITSAVQTLVRLLLLHTAVQTGSSHIVLGTSLTSLAVSLISGVAQGAGFNIREEMQEDWAVPEVCLPPDVKEHGKKRGKRAVRVVRPLRDVGMKECAAWAWWSNVHIVGREKRSWDGARPGIGSMTKSFVVGLERDYPSTVSTIVRTCGKLAPKGEVAGCCVLCGRPAQAGLQEWHSRISIRTRPDAAIIAVPPTSPPASAATLTPLLCYACHVTLTSRSSRSTAPLWPTHAQTDSTPLPVWTAAHISALDSEVFRERRLDEGEMSKVVGEFLLEE